MGYKHVMYHRLLSRSDTPLKITLTYVLVAGLWILTSDILVLILFPSAPHFVGFEIFKGWFFVLATAGMLYVLIKRHLEALLRSQEALRVSEEKYRLLFEQANVAILVLDEAGYPVEVNPQAELLTGYSRSELLAICFPSLILESPTRERFWSVKEMRDGRGESLMKRKEGAPVWVEYVVAPGPHSYLQVMLRDITVRKQAEQALHRQALIFKHLTDGIIVTDLERRIIDWNPAAERIFGYTKEEVLGKLPRIFLLKEGQLDPGITAALSSADYWSGEISYVRKDGQEGVCETQVVLLFDEQGTPIARVGINHDITERKQLEAQFRQAQKMEAIGQLVGGVAHDFNNLLTVINGYVELLFLYCQEETVEPAAIKKDLEPIRRAGEQATTLVRQLLIFSRKQTLQPVVLNLNEVVLTLEKMLHRIIGEDITVMLRLAPALGQVKADRNQMEQMVLNLVVNARDAMPQGGCLTLETANLTLEESATRRSGPYIMIAVTDTGIGMSQETLVHIFEPFFTTKEVGKGTGLGLAMVHSIVEQSFGYITVESEPGQGTVFKIYLSRYDEPPEQLQSPLLTIQQGRGSETVLLVEDEPELRDLIKKVLTQQGYIVLAVGDGKEALHLCSQHGLAIDILLTDVVLPGGINGQTLAEQLWQKCPHLKVLFISGYTDDEIIRQRVLKEEVAFLQKPFSITRLIEKVREALEAPPS